MPVIPTFTAPTDYPGPPALPTLQPEQASQTAEALARGTAGMSDQFAAFADRYAEQKRAIAASDTMIGVDNQLGDAAVKWGRVPDMQKAVAGFNDEAAQIRKSALNGIQDPLIQNLVAERFDHAQITHSWDVRQQSFGLEASQARGSLDMQLAQLAQNAATAPTPEARAQALDDGDRAILARAPMYLTPEDAAKERLMFRSNVQKVQALDFIKRASEGGNASRLSPLAISNAILDPNNFQGLLPDQREQLADQAIRLGRTIVAMRIADETHNEMVADHELKAHQAANAASLIAKVMATEPGQGPAFDPQDLANAVRTQQLSESGFTAVLAAQAKRAAGHDDPTTVTDLWKRANAGEDVSHDALADYGRGLVSTPTVVALSKAVAARGDKGASAIDKQNFASLKTALNGYAIESGVFAGADRAQKAQLWTEAQREWTQRVTAGHENSTAVLSDMLKRYVKQPMAPDGLPTPRLGAVNSQADVAKVWAKTKAAHAAGTMNDATFQSERDLLDRYNEIFSEQQRAAAAAKSAQPGGKAQSLGSSGDME